MHWDLKKKSFIICVLSILEGKRLACAYMITYYKLFLLNYFEEEFYYNLKEFIELKLHPLFCVNLT